MFVLVQLPLFWQGLSMSHGTDDVLQFIPIVFWLEQVGGTKTEDGATAARKERNI